MSRSTLATTLLITACFLSACGDDDPTEPLMETLRLTLTGFEPLQNGFHYEGWAIIDGAPVSTGKFNIDANGGLVTTSGVSIPDGDFDTGIDLSTTATVVLTIEPSGDTDALPADTHIAAGTMSGASAALTVGHASALGSDFADAAGDYILATPTDGMDNNENSGIWFLSLSMGDPAAGLVLPTLPAGWKYEGWAVTGGVPATTGTFTSVSGADDSAPFSGTMDGPPFPGEDYLMNAPTGLTFPTDLAGGTAVISIEPSPDDGGTPFTLKPLVGTIPTEATDHVTYAMDNNAAGMPSGTATIR